MDTTSTPTTTAQAIIAERLLLKEREAVAIAALLQERTTLTESTERRLEAIACELKALGYVRHRTRTAKEAEAPKNGKKKA